MFTDSSVVGCSWEQLTRRLDDAGTVARWAASEPLLVDLHTCDELVGLWSRPDRCDGVLWALGHLAAVDGARDDDALLVVLHLNSPIVTMLSCQLRDLAPDVQDVALAELTCVIRTFKWRAWTRSISSTLAWQTRRAVLDDLLGRDPRHQPRPEVVAEHSWLDRRQPTRDSDAGLDVVEMLRWARGHGVDDGSLELLVCSQFARETFGGGADARIAAERGISRRTVLRRRAVTIQRLRELAPAYLAAVA